MRDKNPNEVKPAEVTLSSEDLLNDPVMNAPAEQAQPEKVTYMPFKDFEARVNQDVYHFRSGVPSVISRDLAADLLRDPHRGYIKE